MDLVPEKPHLKEIQYRRFYTKTIGKLKLNSLLYEGVFHYKIILNDFKIIFKNNKIILNNFPQNSKFSWNT